MYNFDSLRIFTNLYGVRPSVCYPGYVVYTIHAESDRSCLKLIHCISFIQVLDNHYHSPCLIYEENFSTAP